MTELNNSQLSFSFHQPHTSPTQILGVFVPGDLSPDSVLFISQRATQSPTLWTASINLAGTVCASICILRRKTTLDDKFRMPSPSGTMIKRPGLHSLPKLLEWLSFMNNALPLLMDFCEEVQEVWIQHQWSLTQLGLDPECKWSEEALAQRLGVIQQTINSWISDIRALQRASRNNIIIRLNRLGFPPSFWRGWSQGRDMDYIAFSKGSRWEINHIIDCPMSLRAGGHATVSGKHRSPNAKKPNPGNRSTLTDYREKEMIFKFGFWNCRGR